MFPKFSIVIGIVAAALVLVAPAGAVFPTVDGGDSGYAERAGTEAVVAPDFWNYDGSGQKVTNTSPGVAAEDVARLYGGGPGTSSSSTRSTAQAYPESTMAVRRTIEARQGESGQPQWMRALELRGEALNRQHGPQAYPESAVAVTRAIEAQQRLESATRREIASMLDARERSLATGLYVQLSTGTPPDAFERAVAAGPVDGSTLDRFIANDLRFQPRPTPTAAVSVSSGSEIEWPQLGIGFGIGIALVLALLLGIRATGHRPLAH